MIAPVPCVMRLRHFGQRVRIDDHHHRIALRILGADQEGRRHDGDVGESGLGQVVAQSLTRCALALARWRGVLVAGRSGAGVSWPRAPNRRTRSREEAHMGPAESSHGFVSKIRRPASWQPSDDSVVPVRRHEFSLHGLCRVATRPPRQLSGYRLPTAASSRSSPTLTEARRTASRPMSPNRSSRATVGAPRRAQAKWTSPTGFAAVPPSGPAMPVTLTATSARERLERPLGHRPRRLLADRAVPRERRGRNAEQLLLGRVGIDDEAALDHVGRARNLRQQPGDQPAGARFRRRDHQARDRDSGR